MIPSTRIKRLHFIGIGGSGMSGIAEVLHENGFLITGSDMRESSVVDYLQSKGIAVYIGHNGKNIGEADIVVYSSAVKMDNPEIIEAKQNNIPVIRRADMLGELMRLKYTIAIAGTHGKTTTTSIIGNIWYEAKLDPTIIVGGILHNLGTGARLGGSKILIAEADEYDRSFLSMVPTLALITNIDEDHLDCYTDLEDIKKAFIQFANMVPFYGQVIACIDEQGVVDILPHITKPVVTYGFSKQADYRITNIFFEKGMSSFNIVYNDEDLGSFKISLMGKHNITNAAGAVAVALSEGITVDQIKIGLETFSGVKRRMEYLGEVNKAVLCDDYAHHPTEVAATLNGVRSLFPDRKITVVFQPHLYSRTRDHHENFASAFSECDNLYVVPIYGAREEPIEGISGKMIVDDAISRGHKHASYEEDWDKISNEIKEDSKEGDLIILMGAGDINKLSKKILG